MSYLLACSSLSTPAVDWLEQHKSSVDGACWNSTGRTVSSCWNSKEQVVVLVGTTKNKCTCWISKVVPYTGTVIQRLALVGSTSWAQGGSKQLLGSTSSCREGAENVLTAEQARGSEELQRDRSSAPLPM